MAARTSMGKRTAVLVVHGIGSQRAQETMRGVVRAIWADTADDTTGARRIWTHPERMAGVDIDLAVMTTNAVAGSSDNRSVDFHELYWAHLMSETKSLAVLLWLFDLGRKGPHFKLGMNGLWWCGVTFLCLMNLALSLLVLQAITWFSGVDDEPYSLLVAPLVGAIITVALGWLIALIALWYQAKLLVRWLGFILLGLVVLVVLIFAIGFGVFAFVSGQWQIAPSFATLNWLANVLLPPGVALVATWLLMGMWGRRAFAIACILSLAFGLIYLLVVRVGFIPGNETLVDVVRNGWLPWSIASKWSSVVAWMVIAIYLVVNATFLQPYLGDAARYLRNAPANVAVRREIRRQAVATLEELHSCGLYDRIVVVAHSLGSIVAYDMLRTYYGRICGDLPVDETALGPELDEVDAGKLDATNLRRQGREIIRNMERLIARASPTNGADKIREDAAKPKPWLVTDLVTLGSPLTHAYYLMCRGRTSAELEIDFKNRVRERDFLICPPPRLDEDGLLTFCSPGGSRRQFHHGGLFALTRWTNLFFPRTQLFWGDAIGGPMNPTFGTHVLDVSLSTRLDGGPAFFTHNAYWDLERDGGRGAPHIMALRTAIDLEDTGAANDRARFAKIQGIKV